MNKLLILSSGLVLTGASLISAAMPETRLRQTNPLKRLQTTDRLRSRAESARPVIDAPAHITDQESVEVPFTHSLGKNEADITNSYAVFDSNNDTKTWKPGGFTAYSVCMKPTDETIDACDDWMISPAVHLMADHQYSLSIEAGRALTAGSEDLLDIALGLDQTPEAMTIEAGRITATQKDFTAFELSFTVPEEGLYHIGLHAVSDRTKSGNLKVCNLSVSDYSAPVTPPAAGQLSYTLAPGGELSAEVSYTAPETDTAGLPLDEISKVEIYANWLLSETFYNVAPGQTLTCSVSLNNNKYNRIEAVAYAGNTKGEPALVTDFYAGPDNPLPPQNLTLSLSEDYSHVTLAWDPVPAVGENGGFVDTSAVTYYVFDAFGSYYDPALLATYDTSCTFDYSDMAEQDFVAYQVTAGVGEYYYSLESTSGIAVVGPSYPLPYHESFHDGGYDRIWAVDPQSDSYGVMCGTVLDHSLQTNAEEEDAEPVYLNSQDRDNGFFFILPMRKDALYGMMSGKISLQGAQSPVLEFYVQGKGSAIDAMVAADGGMFETLSTIDLRQQPTEGWHLVSLPLDAYAGSDYIQIELRLRAVHNDDETTWSVPVDNIRVRDAAADAMRLAYVSAPAAAQAGQTVEIKAVVENISSTSPHDAMLTLSSGSRLLAQAALEQTAPAATAECTLSFPVSVADALAGPMALLLESDIDAVDALRYVDMAVGVPSYPVPTGLEAAVDQGTVSLCWSAPDIESASIPVSLTEDFENPTYPLFSTTGAGGWTFADLDGCPTYTFMDDVLNPYRTQPQAFQLWDPVAAGVPDRYMADMPPHSGSRMLVAWSANGANDNWLISPELSGRAQDVSLFARSFTTAFPESFELLWSSGSTDPADFTTVSHVEGYPEGFFPEEWTEVHATLPEGARRFALRHNSYDTYCLMVDDIHYEAAPLLPDGAALTGYRVYCDRMHTADTTGTSAEHTPALSGLHTYHVSALYTVGESALSAPTEVEVSLPDGTESIQTAGLSAKGARGALLLDAKSPTAVKVAAADGRLVYDGMVSAPRHISLPAGVYFVEAEGRLWRLMVL